MRALNARLTHRGARPGLHVRVADDSTYRGARGRIVEATAMIVVPAHALERA